jgi:hypothetical protein
MTTISGVTFRKGQGPPAQLQAVIEARGMGVPFEATNFVSSTQTNTKIFNTKDFRRTGTKKFINRTRRKTRNI